MKVLFKKIGTYSLCSYLLWLIATCKKSVRKILVKLTKGEVVSVV